MSFTERLVWVLISGFVLAMLAASIDFELGFDQSIFFLGGQALLEHQALYSEIFDFKPPPLFLLYAGAIGLFGETEYAPRLLEAVFMLLTAWAFVATAHRVADWRMGALAFALYYLVIFSTNHWNTAQAETLSAPAFGLGMLCLIRGLAQGNRPEFWPGVWLIASAALLTFPALMKPTMGGFLPAAFIAAVFHLRGWRKIGLLMRLIGAFGAGALLCLALVLGGAEVFRATSDYLVVLQRAIGLYVGGANSYGNALGVALAHWGTTFLPLTLGMALLLVFLRGSRLQTSLALFLYLSVLIQFVGVVLQGRNFTYHHAATVLPAAVLAGWGLWLLVERSRRSSIPVVSFTLLAAGLVLVCHTQLRSVIYLTGARAERITTGGQDPVWGSIRWPLLPWKTQARALADGLGLQDEPVLIWAHKGPMLYVHGRNHFHPAARFSASTYLRIMPDGTIFHQMMMDDLAHSQPRVIVVERTDADLELASGMKTSDAHIRDDFVALKTLIEEKYTPAEDIAGYAIYVRRDAQSASN